MIDYTYINVVILNVERERERERDQQKLNHVVQNASNMYKCIEY